jgi:hypothetical protein
MYRGGVTRARIITLTGAPISTVNHHLAAAVAADLGLQSAHEQAAAKAPPQARPPRAGTDERAREHGPGNGPLPSRSAADVAERTLASWLDRRRREATAGTLAPAYRDGLAVLPGWQRPPRAVADESRWQDRLKALVELRARGHDWPRHKSSVDGEEHELGVWLHSQRQKARRGELDPAKAEALDQAVPGWRDGRRRGRKAGNGSVAGCPPTG